MPVVPSELMGPVRWNGSLLTPLHAGLEHEINVPCQIASVRQCQDLSVEKTEILVASTVGAFKRLAKQEQLTQQEILEYSGFRPPGQKPPNLKAYKARPLDGIWATAPYLHNGSVPNLYEVLLPSEERSKTFHTGSRKFDTEKVGFETGPSEGSYEVDTSVPGSMNIGHDFGATLEDADRWAVVEFLKTLSL